MAPPFFFKTQVALPLREMEEGLDADIVRCAFVSLADTFAVCAK
jgi:hypothetical protein